jgi:hypothetical protein
MFGSRSFPSRSRERVDDHPNIKVALDELDAWLNDARPYDKKKHKSSWCSMSTDVKAALDTRGPQLTARTTALNKLAELLKTPDLGDEKQPARGLCRQLRDQSRLELADEGAAEAAFDDVVDSVRSLETKFSVVEDRMHALDAVLAGAGRSLLVESQTLANVLDDAAYEIVWVLHDLDGTPLPGESASTTQQDDEQDRPTPPDPDETAGLSLDARLQLCRRLMARGAQTGHHVVWSTYGNARVRPWPKRLDFGPVTFFNGPALLTALQAVADGAEPKQHGYGLVPAELLADEDANNPRRQERTWPKDVEHWVAVRVDLGHGSYADPVQLARDQADALVKLAAFHERGTSWKQFPGYRHFIDGHFRSGTFDLGPGPDNRVLSDRTDYALDELRPHLEQHLPVKDVRLRELLEATAVLTASAEGTDPTSLLQDARIIELVTSRCCQMHWTKHLRDCFAAAWVHGTLLDEIYTAVNGPLDSYELRDLHSAPKPSELVSSVPDAVDRVFVHYDVALAALPALAQEVPSHHKSARRLRTAAAHLSSPTAISAWVDDLFDEFNRLVERLLRCRNSLAHGGPFDLEVAGTVREFANSGAKFTTSLGLWAVVQGENVKARHTEEQVNGEQWRTRVQSAADLPEALDALLTGTRMQGER